MQWPFRIRYGTFSNYSPRGYSDVSRKSQAICAAVKAGRAEIIRSMVPYLQGDQCRSLAALLNSSTVLVPVPRSSLLGEGQVWPAMVIAELLHSSGFGAEIRPCIARVTPVSRSSASGTNRPTVWMHRDSMAMSDDLIRPNSITLIDDVLTLGRTSLGCALLLKEAFPAATINTFAIFRTQSQKQDIDMLIEPTVGTLNLHQSGYIDRDPN